MSICEWNCRPETKWSVHCNGTWEKGGEVNVKTRLNFCTSPALLDMAVRMKHHLWKLSFSPKNAHESKTIGFDYWPMRIHASFLNEGSDQLSLSASLETVKTGEHFHIFNTTVREQQLNGQRPGHFFERYYSNKCLSTNTGLSPAVPFFALTCFTLSFLLLITTAYFVIWRKRSKTVRGDQTVNSNGTCLMQVQISKQIEMREPSVRIVETPEYAQIVKPHKKMVERNVKREETDVGTPKEDSKQDELAINLHADIGKDIISNNTNRIFGEVKVE